MKRLLGAIGLGFLLLCRCAVAQVIEVENNGLTYQTLTRSGITVMLTHLPVNIHEYAVVQVAISNGSQGPYIIRPEDFSFEKTDGHAIRAVPAKTVVDMLLKKATGSDAVKLLTTYENGIYGSPTLKGNNGYEQRRQSVIAASGNRLRTGLLASALTLVQIKLAAGDSTDGAVFFPNDGKPLVGGRLIVRTNTDLFEFNAE